MKAGSNHVDVGSFMVHGHVLSRQHAGAGGVIHAVVCVGVGVHICKNGDAAEAC